MKLKHFLSIALFLLSTFTYAQNSSKLIASCCEDDGGRCTGSAYCSACTNCTGCKHCKSGGTCGACTTVSSSSSKKSSSSANKKSGTTTKTATKSTDATSKKSKGNTIATNINIYINTNEINLRKGPGLNFDVIGKVKKNAKVELISYTGDWANIKVLDSNLIGYIESGYLKQE
ncbi:SH3 domain-containing protein [Polluticaenibacter yanchengensis]|uniref:SH3 domain-containing protein n=1 Tax=Polluticaenibacter yanchengensis TaxID=3014562 RepID=A0ABT4UH16_9BACT|nr:SH3 domain-containing protein [Chitinophagaceae bacterium LY-5]